jgi:anthranilate synthase component 2
MRLLILDNYDSFTYNLFHYAQQLCDDVAVFRNDELTLQAVDAYTHIIISPGPGLPQQAGISMQVLETYATKKSILGVCLGFQAMALWAKAELYNQTQVAHGLSRQATRMGESWLLRGVPQEFSVGLYHSWAVSLPQGSPFYPTAQLENGTLMAFEHPTLPLAGVQFHPESIMTESGLLMLENWILRGR